jgi:hypothetical protein
MANEHSLEDLLGFLSHASDRGLMPAATAQALAVACRNVFGVLTEPEKADLRKVNLDEVIRRFTNKRAKEFNPSSLTAYGRRVHRAVDHFLAWRSDPAGFKVKTRSTNSGRKRERETPDESPSQPGLRRETTVDAAPLSADGSYATSVPVRPGQLVTITGIPDDLTNAEAERLSEFIKMLVVE